MSPDATTVRALERYAARLADRDGKVPLADVLAAMKYAYTMGAVTESQRRETEALLDDAF